VRTEVQVYALEEVNRALDALRRGDVRGAAVIQIP
jgi:D-arabinose 1-dehydrogenase-like Zn-dependent alcohol dehydrogenase